MPRLYHMPFNNTLTQPEWQGKIKIKKLKRFRLIKFPEFSSMISENVEESKNVMIVGKTLGKKKQTAWFTVTWVLHPILLVLEGFPPWLSPDSFQPLTHPISMFPKERWRKDSATILCLTTMESYCSQICPPGAPGVFSTIFCSHWLRSNCSLVFLEANIRWILVSW